MVAKIIFYFSLNSYLLSKTDFLPYVVIVTILIVSEAAVGNIKIHIKNDKIRLSFT